MEKQFSYRIVKIGGKAAAVALTAFGLLAGAAHAQSSSVFLGTQYSSTASGYLNAAGLFNAELSAASLAIHLEDVNSAWNCNSCDGYSWSVGSRNTYAVSQNRGGDIVYQDSVNYTVLSRNRFSASFTGETTVTNQSVAESLTYTLDSNVLFSGTANRAAVFTANSFSNIVDGTYGTDYYFGTGASVSNLSRGLNAYSWTPDIYGGTSEYYWTHFYFNSGLAGGVAQDFAVDIRGNAYFDGNNTINGDVSTYGNYIRGSNVVFNSGYISGDINYENAGTVYLNGTSQGGLWVDGNVNFGRHDGVLNLANWTTINGDVSANDITNATVNFQGSGEIAGGVNSIKAINVLANGSLVRLNTWGGDTTVGAINYSADQAAVQVNGMLTGNVNMNGHYSKLTLLDRNGTAEGGANGMNGVLDFGMYKSNQALASADTYGKGTLEVGDNVNVKFSDDPTAGIKLTNADNATVVFSGNSTVTGDLGSADASKHNTPYQIYAGTTNGGTGGTVTFNGRVYVGAGNLNIGPSNNTVWLNGGLTGNLVFGVTTPVSAEGTAYNTYGDGGVGGDWNGAGTVKLADNQTITGSITTIADGTGTMLFMGSSAYANSIGASDKKLASVVFNAGTAGTSAAPVQSTITGNVYANSVTIGNGTAYTKATMTAGAHVLGDNLTLAGPNTTYVADAAFNTAFSKIAATGMLSNATASRVTVQGGNVVTNGATLKFSVDTNNDGTTKESTSSWIKTSGTGTLVMNHAEKVELNLLGSLKNGASLGLIQTGVNGTLVGPASTVDNSFVITTAATETSAGLVMTASRTNDVYITKSATLGHFSNAAAQRLGELGFAGKAGRYSDDMQVVFNKLDIDQWGYGNNAANLATQVKRLAPIANASAEQSALAATTGALNAVGERLSVLRGDSKMAGTDGNGRQLGSDQTGWVKLLGGTYSAKSIGQYDGFKSTSSGLAAGADTKLENGVVGAMFSYASTSINQKDFRDGDTGRMGSNTLALYGTQEYGDAYVEAALARTQHNLGSNRVTAIDRVANANVDFSQNSLKLGAGYRVAIDGDRNSILTPMISLQSDKLKQDAYSETGADALSLKVDGRNASRTRTSLGLRYNTSFVNAGTTFYPEFSVAANRNSGMGNTDVVASFAGDTSATKFTTTGAVLPRTSYSLSAGLRFATSKTTEVQVGYRFEGGSGISANAAQVRAAWAF